jgi:hypothetical protein
VKWYWKYGRKVSWNEKRFGKYRRKASSIVKRYWKYGRKVSWIVKRYGKCEEKYVDLWNEMENMEEK